MSEENNKNENKLGEEEKKETSEDVVENLKEIEELDKEMEGRKKREKERILRVECKREERKKYNFRKDPSEVFKKKKLKYFVPGGKGEKKMLKALGEIRGIKLKQEKEFARGLKKFADDSVKVPAKPTTLKKRTMINYLKELKKKKYSPLKKSQIRKIRQTFFSGAKRKEIFTKKETGKAANLQIGTEKKFSVSRRTDKHFGNRSSKGIVGSVRRINK